MYLYAASICDFMRTGDQFSSLNPCTNLVQLSKTLGLPTSKLAFEHTRKCLSDFGATRSLVHPQGFVPFPCDSNVSLPTGLQERVLEHAYFYGCYLLFSVRVVLGV